MIKNVLYCTLKAFVHSEYFKFVALTSGHVETRFDQNANINFETHDVIKWGKNDYNKHRGQNKRNFIAN